MHGVHLPDGVELHGTLVHNPRSNMNNGVGYADPPRLNLPVALGTDGIGADMIDEFRLAFLKQREQSVTATPEMAWEWLQGGWDLMPAALDDLVTWSYPTMDPWHLAYTTGVGALDVIVDGDTVLENGEPTRVDSAEVRARAAEQAQRLFAALG